MKAVINTPLTKQELKAVCDGLGCMVSLFAQLDSTPSEFGVPSREWVEALELRLRRLYEHAHDNVRKDIECTECRHTHKRSQMHEFSELMGCYECPDCLEDYLS